ncbi:hypothetical protein ACS0PU_008085 [Formica fusca]
MTIKRGQIHRDCDAEREREREEREREREREIVNYHINYRKSSRKGGWEGIGSLMPVLSIQHATMSNKMALDNNSINTHIYGFTVAYRNIFVTPGRLYVYRGFVFSSGNILEQIKNDFLRLKKYK